MSKPLTVFLQLLALFLLLYGYATEQHGLIVWAFACGVIGAIGIRQRMRDEASRRR